MTDSSRERAELLAFVRALYERPTQLKRHPGGAGSEPIYQKRVSGNRPDWIETARVTFPSGRHADELRIDVDPQPGTGFAEAKRAAGEGEAPYPPNFPKPPGEPKRVQPSRAKKRGPPTQRFILKRVLTG